VDIRPRYSVNDWVVLTHFFHQLHDLGKRFSAGDDFRQAAIPGNPFAGVFAGHGQLMGLIHFVDLNYIICQ
jgi:hypothetical protein